MSIEENFRQETGKGIYADASKEIGFSSEYVNWLEQQLRLYVVSQQREQLISFFNWYKDDPKELSNNETIVDAYLEEINCG